MGDATGLDIETKKMCYDRSDSPKVKKLRRLEENEEFDNLAALLPVADAHKLDRSSILKLSLAYINLQQCVAADISSTSSDSQVAVSDPSISSLLSDEGRLMLDALGGCLFIIDNNHTVLYVTDHVTELLGFTQADLIRSDIKDYIHTEDYHFLEHCLKFENFTPDIQKFVLQIRMRFQIVTKGKSRNRRRTGYQPIEWVVKRAQSIRSHTPAYLVTCRAIVQVPRMDILRFGNVFVTKQTIDQKITFIDTMTSYWTGYDPYDLEGQVCIGLQHPDDVITKLKDIQTMFKTGTSMSLPYRCKKKNGSYLWIVCRFNMVYDKQSKPLHYVATHSVISEKESLERLRAAHDAKTKALAPPADCVLLNPPVADGEDPVMPFDVLNTHSKTTTFELSTRNLKIPPMSFANINFESNLTLEDDVNFHSHSNTQAVQFDEKSDNIYDIKPLPMESPSDDVTCMDSDVTCTGGDVTEQLISDILSTIDEDMIDSTAYNNAMLGVIEAVSRCESVTSGYNSSTSISDSSGFRTPSSSGFKTPLPGGMSTYDNIAQDDSMDSLRELHSPFSERSYQRPFTPLSNPIATRGQHNTRISISSDGTFGSQHDSAFGSHIESTSPSDSEVSIFPDSLSDASSIYSSDEPHSVTMATPRHFYNYPLTPPPSRYYNTSPPTNPPFMDMNSLHAPMDLCQNTGSQSNNVTQNQIIHQPMTEELSVQHASIPTNHRTSIGNIPNNLKQEADDYIDMLLKP